MYTIEYYDDYIYIPGNKNYTALSPILEREENKAGKLTFTQLEGHPHFAEFKKLKFGIKVKENEKIIFKGRIIDTEQIFDRSIFYTVEGKLATLNDSQCRPFSFQGTPEELFKYFIDNHNSQTGSEQQLKVGNVTVTDPNNYISRSWDKTTKTINLIKSRLIDSLGGFLVIRYEDDGDYIDWLSSSDRTSSQKIEFGSNLIDLNVFIDAAKTCTACIPYGAKDEDGNRITIASVNDNLDYIINEALKEEYGIIYAPTDTVTWDDVTRPENLFEKAENWLYHEGIMFNSSIDISFLDLSKLGVDVEQIDLYDNIEFISTPHNISCSYMVGKMKSDLSKPGDAYVSLGVTTKTLTDITLGGNKKTDSTTERVEKIEADYVTNETLKGEISAEIEKVTETFESSIEQTAENISLEVSKSYATKDEVSTERARVDVLSDQLSVKIKTIEDVESFMTFNDEGELIIGKSDSEIKSVQDNDSYKFIDKGGMELLEINTKGVNSPTVNVSKQITLFGQWAQRRGAYVAGSGYNLNDVWIGG